ncbi:MAG: FliG C-terminal domain-containing protein [Myxococcota bacterium]
MKNDIKGPDKAALVLLALDIDVATQVLSHLSETEVKQLAKKADALDTSAVQSLGATFEEFERLMKSELPVGSRAAGVYFRDLAVKALGEERAKLLLEPPPSRENGLEPMQALRSAKTTALAELLQEEHPQLAAVIVAQLPRDRAAQVLASIPGERQADIVGRLASLTEIPAETVALASEAVAKALASAGALGETAQNRSFDGVAFTAGLLNELPPDDTERLIGELNDRFTKVATKVRDAMFTFEDLNGLNQKAVQSLMKEVSPDQLLIALKTASEDLRELFLSSISSRAAAAMREDLALLPPMRLSEVESAQRSIVEAAQRLATEGKITLPGGDKEKLV